MIWILNARTLSMVRKQGKVLDGKPYLHNS
jgi:hypothetical protein